MALEIKIYKYRMVILSVTPYVPPSRQRPSTPTGEASANIQLIDIALGSHHLNRSIAWHVTKIHISAGTTSP